MERLGRLGKWLETTDKLYRGLVSSATQATDNCDVGDANKSCKRGKKAKEGNQNKNCRFCGTNFEAAGRRVSF